MEFRLYTPDFPENTRYLSDCFARTASLYEITPSYFGCRINIIDIEYDELKEFLCRYLFDFYLKDFVLNKIYDEYCFFNTNDAGFVLSELSDSITASFFGEKLGELIKISDSFNPDSFMLFNMKSVMAELYEMTDEAVQRVILVKQRENCIALLKTYRDLSFNRTLSADVEFSSEYECKISFDNTDSKYFSTDEALGCLIKNSPSSITIKNPELCPELAELIDEIFGV